MDHERADSSENPITHFNNLFELDFMQEPEFQNFISAPIQKFCLDYECNHFTNCCTDLQLPPPSYEAIIGDVGGCYDAMDPNMNLIWNQEAEELKGDDHSSETDAARRSGGGGKGDRTRTLISERKRRSGMKEKLYALRSLVPNITKMDKASIVGDAARYIQELQTQARSLKADIATMEATKGQNMASENPKKRHSSNSFPLLKKISKMEMFQVEEKGYYVRMVCNKGAGVAVSLLKALESITSFQVQSSNMATDGDNFVLTFTLNVMVCEFDINLPNLKLWLAGAFLNQGFEFTTFPSA